LSCRKSSPRTAPLPAFGHPLPALRGEGRERGANLVHGPNACEKRKGALHEPPPHPFPLPIRWGEGGRRSGEGWFMVPMRAQKRKVALHEPPPHPIPLPLGGGEGARRAGEGVVHGPNACEKRKVAIHAPHLTGPF